MRQPRCQGGTNAIAAYNEAIRLGARLTALAMLAEYDEHLDDCLDCRYQWRSAREAGS